MTGSSGSSSSSGANYTPGPAQPSSV
jgi:hypothetical protein